ncbi:MAG: VanZ family protein [Lachnospiraceae bacterium]|nr:VanZ family protein [Lachnospiraceae bacterium]
MIKTFLRALLKPFSFLPAICMMCLIFSFSSQDGTASAGLSYQVSEIIVDCANEAFEMNWSETEVSLYIEKIHPYVRKLAHVTEYFLLAVSVSFPLYVYGVRGFWLPLLAGGFCVGFAALDEYHQSFVAGRGPSVRDVCIDSIGILIGVLGVQFVCFVFRKTIFRPLAKKKRR